MFHYLGCLVALLQCCNLLLVETLKDPLCFKVSDQTIPKQQHIVQVSLEVHSSSFSLRSIEFMSESLGDSESVQSVGCN